MTASSQESPCRFDLCANAEAGCSHPDSRDVGLLTGNGALHAIVADTATACRFVQREQSASETWPLFRAHADVEKNSSEGAVRINWRKIGGCIRAPQRSVAIRCNFSHLRATGYEECNPVAAMQAALTANAARTIGYRPKARFEGPGRCFFPFPSACRQVASETSTDRLLADGMSALYRSSNHVSALTSP